MPDWYVYGCVPETGEPWRVTSDQGLDVIPRDGMMMVYQPGTGERPKRNGTWYMFRSDVGVWIEAEDDGSALFKHVLFPRITCTRRGYYALDTEYRSAVLSMFDADVREVEHG
jgi:hypothetical protein